MTLQAIRDGLYTTLTACGPYDAQQISTCSFDPLQATSSCAICFFPGTNSTFEQMTFGNAATDARHWSIDGAIYIKDNGDPLRLLSMAWKAHDDFFSTVKKDRSLNGTAADAFVTAMSYDPAVGVENGGAFWAIITWKLTAEEYDT